MKKARVLFISQDITPYIDETYVGKIARRLPQGIQEREKKSGLSCQSMAVLTNGGTSFMKLFGYLV